MSVRRSLVVMMVGVLLVLSGAVQAHQLGAVLMPVCRVEVTWEKLQTGYIPPPGGGGRGSIYHYFWAMTVVEPPATVEVNDVLVELGPIDYISNQFPRPTNPWIPKKPVILLSQVFIEKIKLQIYARTLSYYWDKNRRNALFSTPSVETTMKTVTCPPMEEELTGTIDFGKTEGQDPVYTYTYKITTKLAGRLTRMDPTDE